jgi:HEAT repeat protein
MGRLIAIEQLKDKKDRETVEKLQTTMTNDSFYGARIEAILALRKIHTDDALEALLTSPHQPDARARLLLAFAINGFYRDTAYISDRGVLENEKNPLIIGATLDGLGNYARPEARGILLKFLNSESYRNQLAGAAIEAMRSQDDPAYIAPLMETLRKREADFRSWRFGNNLETLAYLARNEEKKDAVREFLLDYVNHKNESIQVGAIKALGTLGDPKSLAVLQTFADAAKTGPRKVQKFQSIGSQRFPT